MLVERSVILFLGKSVCVVDAMLRVELLNHAGGVMADAFVFTQRDVYAVARCTGGSLPTPP